MSHPERWTFDWFYKRAQMTAKTAAAKRPPGRPPKPAEERTKPRSVRLTDADWDTLKGLGMGWLERQIDVARKRERKQKEQR